MTDPKQVKKAIMTETKIMSSIEKIMDRIIDPKMQMRIALWIYQKYVADKQPYQVPAQPVDKPAYSYIPRKEYPYIPRKGYPNPYIPRKEYPMPGGVSAYAAPPFSPSWDVGEETNWTFTSTSGIGGGEIDGTASKTTCCSDGGECKCKTGKDEE